MDKLIKFIKENDLKFDGRGSALNADCAVIAGFADYCGITDSSSIIDAIKASKKGKKLSQFIRTEVDRVFDFAFTYNYGNWWKNADAKRIYKF